MQSEISVFIRKKIINNINEQDSKIVKKMSLIYNMAFVLSKSLNLNFEVKSKRKRFSGDNSSGQFPISTIVLPPDNYTQIITAYGNDNYNLQFFTFFMAIVSFFSVRQLHNFFMTTEILMVLVTKNSI